MNAAAIIARQQPKLCVAAAAASKRTLSLSSTITRRSVRIPPRPQQLLLPLQQQQQQPNGAESLSTSSSSCFSTGIAINNNDDNNNNDAAVPVQKGLFHRLYDRFSLQGQNYRIRMAESFFQAATRQASDPRWFGPGMIGRDFRQRHALLTLHIWLLHKRLIADDVDPSTAMLIQEQLFDILWNDTACRIRAQKVREMAVNKHLKKVQQYTFLHLFHYDHIYTPLMKNYEKEEQNDDDHEHEDNYDATDSYTGGDPQQFKKGKNAPDFTVRANRIKELKKLVWMHIMVRDEQAQKCDDHLTRMAWYIEAQYQNILNEWPDAYYREGRIAWIDLPDFSNLRNVPGGATASPVHPEDVIPKPWIRNITQSGDYYYWNLDTREAVWDKPTSSSSGAATSATTNNNNKTSDGDAMSATM